MVSLQGYEINEIVLAVIFTYFLIFVLGIVLFVKALFNDLSLTKVAIKWFAILFVSILIMYLGVRIGVVFVMMGGLITAICFEGRYLPKRILQVIRG